jgi:hypothetical protein
MHTEFSYGICKDTVYHISEAIVGLVGISNQMHGTRLYTIVPRRLFFAAPQRIAITLSPN